MGFIFRLALTAISVGALVQQGPSPRKPSYEVVSIKPNVSGSNRVRVRSQNGGRFVATNASLRMLLLYAYPLLNNEIEGEPGWTDVDRFDVDARPPSDLKNLSMDVIRPMVQSLLEDRFQLKAHFETRNRPVYALSIGKEPRIKLSADQTPVPPGAPADTTTNTPARGSAEMEAEEAGTIMTGTAVPLAVLVNMLQGQTDRRIVDKTNDTRLYDFQLKFFPEGSMSPFGGGLPEAPSTAPRPLSAFPSLFSALQEQLGLRLEPSTAPLQILVIESVHKPSEN
jgi:uncharacterized protein (TIGR03435 family)